jgi:hypothetical protein
MIGEDPEPDGVAAGSCRTSRTASAEQGHIVAAAESAGLEAQCDLL